MFLRADFRSVMKFLLFVVAPFATAGPGPHGTVYQVREGMAPSPLAGVLVAASSTNGQLLRTVRTDAQGRYAFADVPSERVAITGSHSGYYLLRAAGWAGDQIVVDCSNGCGEEAIDFQMAPSAVVTGQVRDAFLEPLQEVRVAAEPIAGQPEEVIVSANATTDDRGQFRLAGLRPGRYVLTYVSEGSAPAESIELDIDGGEVVSGVLITFEDEKAPARALDKGGGDIFAGVVRSAASGMPLRGVTVSLRRTFSTTALTTTTTGVAGEFTFPDLEAGTYALGMNKTGYQEQKGIRIQSDHEGIVNLSFSLQPTGAISGRVLDSDGESVSGASVQVYFLRFTETGVWAESAGQGTSNDLGEYRIYNLDAGKYLVRVRPPTGGIAGGYYAGAVASYYPATLNPSQALPVEVRWGGEAARIDVELVRSASYSVSGVVWDDTEQTPCFACRVLPFRVDGRIVITAAESSAESPAGDFEFDNLHPGNYVLVAYRLGRSQEVRRSFVRVTNRDANELTLPIGGGQPVSGKFVLEGRTNVIPSDDLSVFLASAKLPSPWPVPGSAVDSQLRFRIEDVPAETYAVEVTNLPEGAYVKELRRSGRRLPGGLLTVSEEASVTDIEVVIALEGAIIMERAAPK